MKRSVALLAVLVAAGVASSARAMPFDQLHCHRIRDRGPKRRVRTEVLPRDPALGGPSGCTVRLPARYLCAAGEQLSATPEQPGAAPGPEAGRYLCYRARCDGEATPLDVHDQFGERTLEVKRARLVCTPVETAGVGSTTTSTVAPPDTTSTTMPRPTTTSLPPTPSTTVTLPPPTTTTVTLPPATSTTSTTSTLPSTSTTSTSTTSVPVTTTTTTTLGGPAPLSPGCPVVNEVMTGGASSASEELVEVLNPCVQALDLGGARLLYQSASGATERTLIAWDDGMVLAPGGRLLYATSAFAGPSDGVFAAGLSGSGGGVGVADPGGVIVDGVAWGTAVNELVEGSVAPAPAGGSAIARIPDGADSDDGASDWQETTPTPGAANG